MRVLILQMTGESYLFFYQIDLLFYQRIKKCDKQTHLAGNIQLIF